MAKQIPNILTSMRIIFSFLLFLTLNNRLLFSIFFTICFLTDAFDGRIARKIKCSSRFGENFDDVADTIMVVCMILCMIYWLRMESLIFVPYLAAIVFFRILNGVISKKKYGKVYVTHTYYGKSIGVVCWLMPIIYLYTNSRFILHFAAVCLLLESIELTVIFLRSKTYDPKMKSIFKPKPKAEKEI